MDEISEAIKNDVGLVIDKVLDDKSYENFYLIGKSLGTIAMTSELKRNIFKEAKAVWLTPLIQRDDVFETMVKSKHNSLCFIGDNDQHYNSERYEQLVKNKNIVSKLFPNVNHGLQYENDPVNSIDVLKNGKVALNGDVLAQIAPQFANLTKLPLKGETVLLTAVLQPQNNAYVANDNAQQKPVLSNKYQINAQSFGSGISAKFKIAP